MKTKVLKQNLVSVIGALLMVGQIALADSPPPPADFNRPDARQKEHVYMRSAELTVTRAVVIQQVATDWGSTYAQILVRVVYGNSCYIPDASQVSDFQMQLGRETRIHLLRTAPLNEEPPYCPMNYAPVEVDYILDNVEIVRNGQPIDLFVNDKPVLWKMAR